MGIKLSNNAVSRLASNITNSETSISLTPGSGSLFPTLSAGDWFPVTLLKATGEVEIVKATSRSTDTLTVERAQETTTALAFNAGDIVELRLTAGAIAQAKADAVAEAALPAGFGPVPSAGTTAPTGWLLCFGQAVSRTTYAALFAAIGTTYGAGNGTTTFNLPDMRGRVAAGLDNMGGTTASRITSGGSGIAGTTLGAVGGAETHTLTTAQLAVHNHGATDPTHAHSVYDPGHGHGVYDPGHRHLVFSQSGVDGPNYDPDFVET